MKLVLAITAACFVCGCASDSEQQTRALIAALAKSPPAGLPEDTAAGIRLGSPLSDIERACREANRTWSSTPSFSTCSGPISSTLATWHGTVRLLTCETGVCAMFFEVNAHDEPAEIVGLRLIRNLQVKAGPPMSEKPIPEECQADETFTACVRSGALQAKLVWEVAPRRWEIVSLFRDGEQVRLHVGFFDDRFAAQQNRAAADGGAMVDSLFQVEAQ